mmetsp:Transcript_29127/g.92959  ORF Transcript_29127/g.92959 Transcript_29127/m.92959 type:complete len:219 (+) Transcript_29127:873-1529(+)
MQEGEVARWVGGGWRTLLPRRVADDAHALIRDLVFERDLPGNGGQGEGQPDEGDAECDVGGHVAVGGAALIEGGLVGEVVHLLRLPLLEHTVLLLDALLGLLALAHPVARNLPQVRQAVLEGLLLIVVSRGPHDEGGAGSPGHGGAHGDHGGAGEEGPARGDGARGCAGIAGGDLLADDGGGGPDGGSGHGCYVGGSQPSVEMTSWRAAVARSERAQT